VDVAAGTPVYTIGRYEIAGHLATGGMAEILLGRMVGLGGFERAVVIKRILPHLARDAHFRDMFLDEARLAARIRHPNVVQVYELMEEEGELFIVMEYLEGENLAGLMRRMSRRGEVLSPLLAAHLIAEAAAGLHAAHELTDMEGSSLGLVHRDVSPQNVFVCYDGTVKMLDFGVATAADKLSRTETGQLKGKFEYMSPEQCAGKDLDRRSDVFSLGTILWETSTGHRLFKFPNKLLVLKAILDTPIKPPSEVLAGYPKELEDVVVQALACRRAERYQTAEALQRALQRVARRMDLDTVPDQSLADLMVRLFRDRMDEKLEMLNRLRSGSQLTHLPAPEVDAAVELPTVGERPVRDPSVAFDTHAQTEVDGVSRIQPTPSARELGRDRRATWVVVGLSAAAMLGGGAWALASGMDGSPAPPLAQAPSAQRAPETAAPPRALEAAPTAAEQSSEARPRETIEGPDAPEVVTAEPIEGEAPPAEADSLPPTVVLRVDSSPAGVEVLLDGVARGTTPIDLHVLRGEELVEIELRKQGWLTEIIEATPDLDQRLRIHMSELEPAPDPRRRRRQLRRRRAVTSGDMAATAMTAGGDRRYHRFE